MRDWANPIMKRFGGSFELVGKQTIKDAKGRTYRLTRPARDVRLPGGNVQYISLRDLVRALGGTYRYNASREAVEIRIPSR